MSAAAAARILVADDDGMLRDIATAMLENAGFAVEAVGSGAEALAACLRQMPQLVLLDVEMPDGNGYQACSNIRALPGGADVPIVMVTGFDDPTSIHLAYDAGATDFVVKPINWPLLAHRVRYVLRGARTVEALRFSEQKNSALLKVIPDGIFLVDAAGLISHCYSPIKGLVLPPSAAPRLEELVPPAARARAMECLESSLRGHPVACEFSVPEAEDVRHFECRFLPKAGGQALAIVRDVTQRKQTEAHIHRLAYFDGLTGLPNREWISEYLSQALAEAAGRGEGVALLFVDLDQFKRINDTLGHETGDALLRQVAGRLSGALAAAGVAGCLARVGGDEFIIVLSGPTDLAAAERVAQRAQAALAAAFVQDTYELVVTPSIGIALCPEHGSDTQTLLKHADAAMYEAKESGRNQARVYTSALNNRARKRLSLEMELRRAFEAGQLEVHYQPQYEAHSLNLAGAEALLRWFHPERGQIPTSDFVAVAEETGLIGEIGRWALQQVCRDLGHWRGLGLAVPPVAVNISGRDFMRQDVLLRLAGAVEAAHLPASLFELELTEGVLMRDVESGQRSLQALKEFGFALAIDDFGTGYCSLNYLKRFALDTLKVDRAFVNDIAAGASDAAIVRSIIGLGHNLNLKIVAEGVETPAQLEFLRAAGCDLVQGFLMSRAVPPGAYVELLRAGAARAGAVAEVAAAGTACAAAAG
ncbi:MAG TPA: EAL domain-containing protein [Steroidobacteraceae bacterium]|nr:EAL domain-containing protein [Steroidobacteraceae bacterium]